MAVSPGRFRRVLSKHMARATELNGLIGARVQREVIQSSRGMAANAALTVFIKGSSKPLVNHADLFGSITYEVVNEFTVFVGVLRQDEDGFNIALALHEGFQVRVTPAMRGMFLYLWKVGKGEVPASKLTGRAAELWAARPGNWLPLSEDTEVITTPGRPWATIAFSDRGFKSKVAENWNMALEATFRELAGKSGGSESKATKLAKKAAKTAKKLGRTLSRTSRTATKHAKAASKLASKYGKRASKIAKRASKTVSKRVRSVKRSLK